MRCATSLDEFTIGQYVRVAAGLGCYQPGTVGDITRTKVVVLYDDCERVGFHRPDEIVLGELPVGQLELFGAGS